MQPYAQGNKEHISDYMVKAEGYKGKDGQPNAHDLGGEIFGLHGQKTRKTDQPVTSNAAQKYLMELRRNLFLAYKRNGCLSVGGDVKDTTICFSFEMLGSSVMRGEGL